MATQRETTLVVEPFCNHLTKKGWHVENTHGNQYQRGFPDKYIMHTQYDARWIEFKVIEKDGYVKWTTAQQKVFPLWLAHGVKIYVIAAHDLRGEGNYHLRESLYKKILYEEPNAMYLFNKMTHKLMY